MKRLSVLLSGLVVLGVLLSACGSSVANDPASVVQGIFQALQAKNISAMQSLTCAQERDQIAARLIPGGRLTGASGATDAQTTLDAINITIADLSATKTSDDGNHAVVHVKGSMTMTFDKDKMAAVLKSSGADESTIANSLLLLQAMFGSGIPMDTDVDVIQENGKWVVCD